MQFIQSTYNNNKGESITKISIKNSNEKNIYIKILRADIRDRVEQSKSLCINIDYKTGMLLEEYLQSIKTYLHTNKIELDLNPFEIAALSIVNNSKISDTSFIYSKPSKFVKIYDGKATILKEFPLCGVNCNLLLNLDCITIINKKIFINTFISEACILKELEKSFNSFQLLPEPSDDSFPDFNDKKYNN